MFGKKQLIFAGVIVILAVGVSGCRTSEGSGPSEQAGLPNPASVYCEGLGYELDLQSGMCIFPDGSECEEWDFLAGRCGSEYSYCEQQGFVLESDEDSNIGTCVFNSSSSCMEFEYFQGECGPGK